MGDLVAVFQTGGVLAQFGTPLDILAAPASEFVARFVGQDRGLKRLSLLRVGDVAARSRRSPPGPATTPPTPGAGPLDDPFALPAAHRRGEPAASAGSPDDDIPARAR